MENKKEIKKTSDEWMKDEKNLTVLDPDGWDRKNYEFSFYKELITKEEFNNRVFQSTCILKK